MGVEVRAPDGRVWQVHRSFPWPRWRKLGTPDLTWSDYVVGATDSIGTLALIVLAFVAVALIIVLFLPLLLFLVQAVLVGVGLVLVLRPWRLVAETEGPPPERRESRVRGWRASKRAVDELARELSAGVPAEPEQAE